MDKIRYVERRKVDPFIYAVIRDEPGEDQELLASGIVGAKDKDSARIAVLTNLDLEEEFSVDDLTVRLLPF